jgi:uncharacterized protein YraI
MYLTLFIREMILALLQCWLDFRIVLITIGGRDRTKEHLVRGYRGLSAWLAAVLCFVVVVSVACNFGVTPATPTPRISPTSSIKPVITIQAPQNNADAVVNQAITVQASGSHPEGVTRLELRANGQQVDSKVSQNQLGDQQFSAYLNYTPTVEGTLILQVLAWRGGLSSDPAAVTVNVKSQQAQITSTVAAPTAFQPQATFDPRCRARVEVQGLNFRQGPSQNYPPFQVLALGNIVFITGRLADNTWWQGRIGNTLGWMSASYITLLGVCSGVSVAAPPASPVPTATITNTVPATVATPIPGKPDLVVLEIIGPISIVLNADNTKAAIYQIRVRNKGGATTAALILRLVLPDGTLRDLGVVQALAPQQTAVFQTEVTFNAPGSVRLTAIVDSNNTIDESDETNNLKSLDLVLIKPTVVPTTPSQATSAATP